MASYTQATGKRPHHEGLTGEPWSWFDGGHAKYDLPCRLFGLLEGGEPAGPTGLYRNYPTEAAALAAADAAYERAVAEGAMGPIEGVA